MDDMKDSVIPWLGEIPAEWDIKRLKYIANYLGKGNGITKAEVILNGDTPCVRYGEIYSKYDHSFNKCITRTNIDKINSPQYFSYGDILFAGTGELVDEIGKNIVYLGNEECLAGGDIIIMKHSQQPSYLSYALNSSYAQIQKSMGKAKLKVVHISSRDLGNLLILLPPVEEQRRIADFLDEKCGEIDGIVGKIQQEIETLKQYKQSIISEAVTKGIRPNVPMKDSHVEWIKKIPKTWEISKFKYLCQIKSNLVTPEQYKELPQISPDNIEKDSGKLLTYCTVEESGIISGNHLFTEGQILYSKIRPNLNKVTIAPFDGLCSADMYPIETKNPKFVLYMMLSKYFVDQVSVIIRDRVKMPKINQEELGRIRIAVPPLEEQREIAAYLDQKCAAIDGIISSKEEQLQTLDAYKKSLIYEYVTGKKRVPTA